MFSFQNTLSHQASKVHENDVAVQSGQWFHLAPCPWGLPWNTAPDPVYAGAEAGTDGGVDLQDFAAGVLDAIGSIEEDPRDRAAKEKGKRRKKSFRQRMREAAAAAAAMVPMGRPQVVRQRL